MAFNDPEIERLAAPKRRRMAEIEGDYQRAKAWATSFGDQADKNLLREIELAVMCHNRQDPPHSAVFVVAQVRQMIVDRRANAEIIREYERLKSDMESYHHQDRERTGSEPSSSQGA